MEKNVELSVLCQIYGKLLTEKQYILLNDYYNNDLSFSEIAENNNITRQAVRDIIKQGENKLFEYEEKLKFMKKEIKKEKQITEILNNLNEIETTITDNILKKNIKYIIEKIQQLD